MARIYVPALILYGFLVVHPGDNITLQCTNVLKVPGHVAWFKQVNDSEPLCIASMYTSELYVNHHNGFQSSHMEMLISNIIIFLTITEVDVADSGLYFCGLFQQYLIFTNMTVLTVQGNVFNHFSAVTTGCYEIPFPLVLILGVVTAVLLIVIFILVLKIIRDANRHNTEPVSQTRGPGVSSTDAGEALEDLSDVEHVFLSEAGEEEDVVEVDGGGIVGDPA
ncbi:uncharacterized protein LOC123492742 [Coregonus clupeaformis]|uniref:uncharacterized protein LOC123492742 n=1 Tax=Coregonus clupeaformis TaxID=59861 RepID=UPI001E1C6F5B|nr:uncharacterized protein LOC123492742 [Coregonus clupeaformis]